MLVADSAAFWASAEAAGSMHLMSLSRGKAICMRITQVRQCQSVIAADGLSM